MKVLKENGAWIVIALGIILAGAGLIVSALTLGTGGFLVALAFLGALAVAIYVVALRRSYERAERQLREQADKAQAEESTSPSESQSGVEPEVAAQTSSFTASASEAPPPDAAPQLSLPEAGSEPTAEKPEPDVVTRIIQAVVSNAPHEVRSLTEEWVREALEDDERLRRRSIGLQLGYQAGDLKALEDLRDLADEHPQAIAPLDELTDVMAGMGLLRDAAEELARRIPALDGEDAVGLRIKEANLRRRSNQPDVALILIDQLPVQPTEPDLQARALTERGYALEKLGRRTEAFGCFERSLELSPNNSTSRFHLAWEYGEDNLHELALFHWRLLLRAEPENLAATNNLGVTLHALRMPSKGSRMFKQAMESGYARSAGNLAFLALEGGLLDEAQAWIAKGRELDSLDARVGGASAGVATQTQAEAERDRAVSERARSLRDVVAAMGEVEPVTQLNDGLWSITLWPGLNFEFVTADGVPTGAQGSDDGLKRIVISSGPAGVGTVNVALGKYGLRQFNGSVKVRGDTIVGYLKDWTVMGDNSPFEGQRIGPVTVDLDPSGPT